VLVPMKPAKKISRTPPAGWPSEKEWSRLDKRLEKAKGSRVLPANANFLDKFKYELCRQFVVFLRNEKITQRVLAKKLGTTESRVSEIVHYHLDKVTSDRLIDYLGVLKPEIKVKIK
jgi:predicted XRE-type DNA-binding protein